MTYIFIKKEDRSVLFLITAFSSFIIMMLIYGIIKNKPSYLMPYFSIKVFQVVMSCLTTLGFYSCLPNVRMWIQNHNHFPFKSTILVLDNQTLELFVFSILLSSILIKLYTCIIVWYCYRYMLAVHSFNSMGSSIVGGAHRCRSIVVGEGTSGINFDDNLSEFKIDDETLINQPPKYEDVVSPAVAAASAAARRPNKKEDDMPRTSNSLASNGPNDLVNLPTYSSLIARQNERDIV
jgi:hypothetical protein